MTAAHRPFGSLILLTEVFADDLGHLFRAGDVVGGAIGKILWLRLLDGDGVPAGAVIEAFEIARAVADAVHSTHLPSDPRFVDDGGLPAIGCEYVPGQPLNRLLARSRDEAFPMQPDNALLIADKIAIALSSSLAVELRGQALAHGFLHPGLIHVSLDGEALVTGLGLGDALLDALEGPGAVPGIRPYLAPEVLTSRSASKRGDVYSLGAILFHLLTGTALPAAVDERPAALDASRLADSGEPLPDDIRSLLGRALAPAAGQRFSSVVDLRAELERLIYGGSYSPTTFNLALFMDRLFRAEIEADEAAVADEQALDPTPYLTVTPEPAPEAVAPAAQAPGRRFSPWMAVAGAAVVVAAAAALWWFQGGRASEPPPAPTPTADEIAAQRQAQEDRLTALTQEMVKQMMAEREEEIRQELVARQNRIEELQRRLAASEKRASTNSAASKDEAQIQQALKRELAEAEEAQREQAEALEAERQRAALEATPVPTPAPTLVAVAAEPAAGPATAAGVGASSAGAEAAAAAAKPSPTARVAVPTPAPVRPGDFVPPEELDSEPVVIKTEPLDWPRSAMRSQRKGVVVVQVTVNAAGGVNEVSVLRADDNTHGIPEAAVKAASGYRFKPGIKDGITVTTYAFITWRYDFTEH